MFALIWASVIFGCGQESHNPVPKSLPVYTGSPNTYLSPQANTFGSRRRFYVDTLIPIGVNDTLRFWKLPGSGKYLMVSSHNGVHRGTPAFSDLSGAPDMSDYYPVSNPDSFINTITAQMVMDAMGYEPLENETDPIFSLSAAQGITSGNISQWNTAFSWGNHSTAGYLHASDTTGKWRPISYVPSWASITNKPSFSTVAVTGAYSDLSGTPSIPTNTNQLANGAGFIATETDPQFDTKFATKTTTGLTEGTNQYFTNARARAAISLTTTGSGAASYNSSTGALNIPTFSGSPVRVYNGSGQVNQSIKIWTDVLTPTTGNGYSVDISSAGFGTVLSVMAISEFSTGTTTTMRNAEIKSYSTSAVVVNIAVPNATVVSLLSLTLLGVPTFLPSGTGTKLHLTVIGY